jgi:hypothetical protein
MDSAIATVVSPISWDKEVYIGIGATVGNEIERSVIKSTTIEYETVIVDQYIRWSLTRIKRID